MTDLLSALEAAGLHIHAAEFVLNGETLFRVCPDGDTRYPVYSITKSVTSAAFCLACDDGAVSPEMPLADFLEEKYSPLISAGFSALPFSRFLTMTAGKYPFRPDGDDWLAGILSMDTDHSDTGFHYSNIPAYLVGAALENALDCPLADYLDCRLFQPLGIAMPPYRTSPEGHFYGATGMELTVRELAVLGQLYLQHGVWQGSRIISESSLLSALRPYVDTGSGDSYGYFFRVLPDCCWMSGKWGQRCIVFPEKGLVAAYLSDYPAGSEKLHAFMESYARSI